jgi:hypothetical protein
LLHKGGVALHLHRQVGHVDLGNDGPLLDAIADERGLLFQDAGNHRVQLHFVRLDRARLIGDAHHRPSAGEHDFDFRCFARLGGIVAFVGRLLRDILVGRRAHHVWAARCVRIPPEHECRPNHDRRGHWPDKPARNRRWRAHVYSSITTQRKGMR